MTDSEFATACQAILAEAIRLAETSRSWAAFSNAIYAPGGVIHSVLPDRNLRIRFQSTNEYDLISAIKTEIVTKFGLVEGARP